VKPRGTIAVSEAVPLAPLTTLQVGGKARYMAEVEGTDGVRAALDWAVARDVPLAVLGGGSNLLVADRGFEGLVLRVRTMGRARRGGRVRVGAGEAWDPFARWAAEHGLAGVECLAGIPGGVGAAPMQNVGAYGQEVSQTIASVEVVDRRDGAAVTLSPDDCAFGYRDSVFKREAEGRYVVTAVTFSLREGGAPTVAYGELKRHFEGQDPPDLKAVRDAVVMLRRRKSMVLDPDDENGRSAGSFFVNPTVARSDLPEVEARAERAAPGEAMPRFDVPDGRVKIPAAWLIERSGLSKGTHRGAVGLSTKHCLAIVNRGGATAADVVAFAAEVRGRVRDTFGVTLSPEPRTLGFIAEDLAALRR